MSQPICKVLFLKVPGADDGFGRQVAESLSQGDVHHEFVDVAEVGYEAILDRLEPGVLPVVLKAPR